MLPRWRTSAQQPQRDYWCNAYYTNIEVRLRAQLVCNYTNKLNPNKKIRHSCSWAVLIIKAFWIYASFTTKRRKVVFCLDSHSTGQINLVHKWSKVKYKTHPHLLVVNYFHKKAPLYLFDLVLNTRLIIIFQFLL